MGKFKIQYLPVGQLVLNPKNPRLIKDAAFKRLVKSLTDCPALFDARPCVCSDRTGENVIMGGNMRYLAAKELKYKEVPAIIMSGLTPEQEREIVIKDNGDAFGEWDFSALANSWGDLPLVDWGVGMPQHWGEASLMAKNFNQGKGEEEEAPDTTDTPPGKYPVTFILDQPEWEQWEAAKARLKIQGDKSAFLKLIGGNHA